MLRRSVVELSFRRSLRRIPRQVTAQPASSFIYLRKEFSTVPGKGASSKPRPSGNPPESKGGFSTVALGGAVISGALLVAYQSGYLDQYLGKQQTHVSDDSADIAVDKKEERDIKHIEEPIVSQNKEPNLSNPSVELPELKAQAHSDLAHPQTKTETQDQNQSQVENKSDVTHEEVLVPVQEKELPEHFQSTESSADHYPRSGIPSQGNLEKIESKTIEQEDKSQTTSVDIQSSAASKEDEENTNAPPPVDTVDKAEDVHSKGAEEPSPLLDTYHLRDKELSKEAEAFATTMEELNEGNGGYLSKDGKLVFDFLQAIHAAEKRQAELDALAFAEEKRVLKEKYEKELRDLRARELMRIEEAAILDKELKREKAKAAAAVKSLQEKMEERLKTELEQKEREEELKLQKAQELAKAELVAAIASEKAAQIEKVAEANLHINALCMAFYARTQEAHKRHSAHKLALGALALEDALSKGLPIQKEIDALKTDFEGIEKDSVLDLVLSSLPEETQYHGTDTVLQLNQKFKALEGTLRHFSLIPPGGGGIMTHALARVASWLKVKKVDQSGEGIESVICRVENYLSDGKLAEAASALEEGVKGSQAEEIVSDWVKRARDRAITEQALMVLQSYATCISLT
ncbi:hypothetical protein SLE2022_366210 [Rubroshorea leprosula]